MVLELGSPEIAGVGVVCAAGDGDHDHEDVGLGVGEGSKAVVGFLSGGVEEAEGKGVIADPGGVNWIGV